MAQFDNYKNFVRVKVNQGYDSSATHVVLDVGDGADLPAVPFNLVWFDSDTYPDPTFDPNREIVRATAVVGDTVTVTRGQEGIAATSKNTFGKQYSMIAGLTEKFFADLVALDARVDIVETNVTTLQAADVALDTRIDVLEAGTGSGDFVAKYPQVYDARDYLPNDGTTDATAALQALIDEIGTNKKNAIIELDDIDYVIGGALQDPTRRNAQILLPMIAITEEQYSIKFHGQSTPACSPSVYEPIVLPRGARIRSTLSAGSGTQPSVISGRGPAGGYIDETNYLHAEFENIILETIPNPSYSCLNLQRQTSVRIKDCIINAGSGMDVHAATQPTTATSYGLILPDYNRGILCDLQGQINIFGFYTGMRAGELMHAQNIGLWWCIKGIEFGFSYHAALIERLLILYCHAGASWTGVHPVDIKQWDNEHTLAGESAWYASVYDVYDPSNYGTGDITWLTVRSSFGRESVFVVNGGANLNIREVGAPATAIEVTVPPVETGVWKWSSTISGGMANYEVGVNNATVESSSLLRIAEASDSDFDASAIFARLGVGDDITIRDRNDISKFVRYDLAGAGSDLGTYWTFPVVQAAFVTPTFVDDDQVVLTFTYGGTPTPPMVALIYDSFSGLDGVSLPSHTPDIGAVWTKVEGDSSECTIQNGGCRAVNNVSLAYSYIREASAANVTLTCKMWVAAGSGGQHYTAMIIRATDTNNYLKLQISDLSANNFTLEKHEAGADTVLAQATIALSVNTWLDLEFSANGSALSATAGTTTISATNSFNATATKCGFRLYCATANFTYLDDHKVEAFTTTAAGKPSPPEVTPQGDRPEHRT